jgi:nicotinic acid phosphoribosyltransferase
MKLEPIVVSLLDTDLYKFNMDQVIFHKHTDLSGEYYFRCRNKGVTFTRDMYEEINAQIDHLCTLTFTKDELDYVNWLPADLTVLQKLKCMKKEEFEMAEEDIFDYLAKR